MSETVGVGELRQNLSRYLRRIEQGERLVVTDRNRPVAELRPLSPAASRLDRLVEDGVVRPPSRTRLPGSLRLDGDLRALSRALADVRGER